MISRFSGLKYVAQYPTNKTSTSIFVSHLEIGEKLSILKKVYYFTELPIVTETCRRRPSVFRRVKRQGVNLTFFLLHSVITVVQMRVCYMRYFQGKIKRFGVIRVNSYNPFLIC